MAQLRPVLLVEDSPNDIELTLAALEKSRLANPVVVARDGVEALDLLFRRGNSPGEAPQLPAVVLLDIKLPRMDGLEVLEQLRREARTRSVPVVMLTSSREEQDLIRSYGLGVNAFVVKPVGHREFFEAIRDIGAFWAVLNEPPPEHDGPGLPGEGDVTAPQTEVAPEDGSCRILHLEDSAIDAELIAEYLAHSGFANTVQLVGGQADYIAALNNANFDLILADYVLPDFDGLAALARAREIAPDTPFIFVSGTMGEEVAVEAVRNGATDYVIKQRLARLPIAVRRALADAQARASQRETLAALRDSESRLRLALEAGRLGTWELDLRSHMLKASTNFRAVFGQETDADFSYNDLRAAIHLEDRERVGTAVARSIAEHADCDIEYRVVQPDGTVCWLQVRGRPIHALDGTPLRLAGVSLDITERKLTEERQALLSREVDHRAKNALAVVQAMLRLTKATDMPSYVRSIEGRVASLVRAQALLVEDRWAGADLRALLEGELAPFLGADVGRAVLEGPRVSLPVSAVQPLAMVAHELATNAVKYGALSVAEGRVSVCWHVIREADKPALLRLEWMETAGPLVKEVPKRRGFGGRMLDSTVRSQLGGKLVVVWEKEGLVCNIQVPLGAATKHMRPPDVLHLPQPSELLSGAA